MAFKLKSLYGVIGAITEKLGAATGKQIVDENENEYKIISDNSFYHIPDLKVNIHNAELYIYDNGEYMLSDIMYLFFDTDKNRLVYSEQGSNIPVSVYNYCRMVLKNDSITMREVEEIDCVYQIDDGDTLKNLFKV